MINDDERLRLLEALARVFDRAKIEVEKTQRIAPVPVKPDADNLPEHKKVLQSLRNTFPVPEKQPPVSRTPQVCSLLLCTGAIVSGMVLDPISYDNLDAPDAVQSATQGLQNLPGLKKDFKIRAVAMSTTLDKQSGQLVKIDLRLYEQSLSEIPNLIAPYAIMVDPVTNTTAPSAPFSDYRIL